MSYREVDKEPDHYRHKGLDYQEAESYRDWVEMTDEVAAWVVKFGDHYYVVYAD